MNTKGIAIFLAVTFGFGYLCQGIILATGLLPKDEFDIPHAIVLYSLMLLPALGAFLAARATRTTLPIRLRPLPKKPALMLVIGVALAFSALYTLTGLAGWAEPDWELSLVKAAIQENSPDIDLSMPMFLVAGLVFTAFLGATFYALVCLATEIGWRAFLLPQLLPLGRVPAYLLGGVLWGLWHAPMVLLHFTDPETNRCTLLVRVVLLAIALSAVLGEVWRRFHHVGLSAILLGSFLSHVAGIWMYLFPDLTAPWAGPFGYVNILLWYIIAISLLTLQPSRSKQPQTTPCA